MTIKDSEHYLAEAAAALELARQQTHSAPAMEMHTNRARALMEMYDRVMLREVTGLTPVEPSAPVAVLDCHDRLWERGEGEGFATPGIPDSTFTYDELAAFAGPLRPAEPPRSSR